MIHSDKNQLTAAILVEQAMRANADAIHTNAINQISISLGGHLNELENAIGNLEANFDRLADQVAELAKRMGRPQ